MVYKSCFIAAFTLVTSVMAMAAPMDNARRWVNAKFLGLPDDYVAPATCWFISSPERWRVMASRIGSSTLPASVSSVVSRCRPPGKL